MAFTKKVVVTPKLTLKLELDLLDSSMTADEATERIQYLINSYNFKEFSNLIVTLMRETRSSMWDLKSLELEGYKEDQIK